MPLQRSWELPRPGGLSAWLNCDNEVDLCSDGNEVGGAG